jgi:hypothetical protein
MPPSNQAGVILSHDVEASDNGEPGAKLPHIAICKEKLQELSVALAAIQGSARADILVGDDLLHFAETAERKLEQAGIAASYRAGAALHVTPLGPSCTAYKYPRIGTAVHLERKASGWVLVHASRQKAWPRQQGHQRLTLTTRQKVLALKQACGIDAVEARSAIDSLRKVR